MRTATRLQRAFCCGVTLLLLGVLLAGQTLGTLPASAATPFVDVLPADPAYIAIGQLHARSVINGYPTNPPTFGPADTSLRAQMAALIGRAMGWRSDEGANPFADRCTGGGCVDDELWGYIATLARRDVAKGYGPTTYAPFDNVLQQQVILFISRAKVERGDWIKQPDNVRLYPGSAASVSDHQDIVTYVHYAGAPPDAPTTLDSAWGGFASPATRGWFARALWQAYPEGAGSPVLPGSSPTPSPAGSRIAIPSYFYPDGAANSYWGRLNAAAPTVGLAIINPDSGPGSARSSDYAAQVERTKLANVLVLGYVATGYGQRAIATASAEISAYFDWYQVDGIFLDEASVSCADLPYYKALYDAIKARGLAKKVVINPGIQTNQCYMDVADIVLTFEDRYTSYVRAADPPAWVRAYPAERFWHLIYATGTIAEMRQAIALSKARHAGWVYVTPDGGTNPWDTLPDPAYWAAELNAIP